MGAWSLVIGWMDVVVREAQGFGGDGFSVSGIGGLDGRREGGPMG